MLVRTATYISETRFNTLTLDVPVTVYTDNKHTVSNNLLIQTKENKQPMSTAHTR